MKATRRAEVESKQATIAQILTEQGCEACFLFMPYHVTWFTGGLVAKGLIADSEKPGIYTNGKQRWLVCSNADTQRLFDDELDELGFQVKEWHWKSGRAALLADLIGNKKLASDRPFPGMPVIVDKLRPHLAQLQESERKRLESVGKDLSDAITRVAQKINRGQTETEVVGLLAEQLYSLGLDPGPISVTSGTLHDLYPRRGWGANRIEDLVTIQATASRGGLHATSSRSVCFGQTPPEFRKAYEAACQAHVIYRGYTKIGETVSAPINASSRFLQGTPYEHEWYRSSPGYFTGWTIAEEIRKPSHDEVFSNHQPIVWQTSIGPAKVVDTFLITENGAKPLTHVEGWPFRRIQLNGKWYDVPEILTRQV